MPLLPVPPPTLNVFSGHTLTINDLPSISSTLEQLRSAPSLAQSTTTIQYHEPEQDLDVDIRERPQHSPHRYDEHFSHLATIMNIIQENGGIKVFGWSFSEAMILRPKVFFESLLRTYPTLRELRVMFYQRELNEIHKMGLLIMPFEKLTRLDIDAGWAHGDAGFFVNELINNSPSVKHLTLEFPGCDLDSCRIQDISWDYALPRLETFSLDTWIGEETYVPLERFFKRHSGIKSLGWAAHSYEPHFYLKPELFPNIKAFRSSGRLYPLESNKIFEFLAESTVVHLKSDDLEEIGKLGKKLKCLELDLGLINWREGTEEAHAAKQKQRRKENEEDEEEEDKDAGVDKRPALRTRVKNLLKNLEVLQEVILPLSTKELEENYELPPSMMDFNDLKSILEVVVLSGNKSIRCVTMIDDRGLPLPRELLNDIPAPENLEYINWCSDLEKGGGLYRLERSEGQVTVVRCEPVRHLGHRDFWVEKRTLNYQR